MPKNFFVHPQGINESKTVGRDTRIWAFAHVLPGARIGRNCNICDQVFIENDVIVGDDVTVKCGVQLWNGLRVADRVFIGPNVTFTNDPFPRSKRQLKHHPLTVLSEGCSIGANATILPGLTIGRLAMVGAGAVVTQSVPDHAIVVGNPARITGYVGVETIRPEVTRRKPATARTSVVRGVSLRTLPEHSDMRGDLCVAEYPRDLPFVPRRQFLVYHVPSPQVRGEHAHRRCHQFLICVHGSCRAVVDDGRKREEFILDDRRLGLHLPPLTWCVHYRYTPESVLLVLASRPYEPKDYIRDYDEFRRLARRR